MAEGDANNFNGNFGTTTVSYNGVSLVYPVVRYKTRSIESESGRTQKYLQLIISVSGYVRHTDTGDKQLTVHDILAKLSIPGKSFMWKERGEVVIQAQPYTQGIGPDPASFDDVLFGPKSMGIEVISNWKFMTQLSFVVVVTASPTTQYPDQAITDNLPNATPGGQVNFSNIQFAQDTSFQSRIIDNSVAVNYTIDQNHRTVRSVSGRMTIAGAYGVWNTGGADGSPESQTQSSTAYGFDPNLNPWGSTRQAQISGDVFWGRLRALNSNRFIGASFAKPPNGFVRAHQNYSVSPDGVTLIYSIVDREVDSLPPFGTSDFDVGVSIEDEDMQLGSVKKNVWGRFEIPPNCPDIFYVIREVIVGVLTNYVVTDPEALTWIYRFMLSRTSVNTNSWSFEICCVHQRSLLYEEGLGKCGIFGTALNPGGAQGTYAGWAKPYGDAGLAGDGYRMVETPLLGDLKESENPIPLLTEDGGFQDGDKLSEQNILMHNEKVEVKFMHTGSAVAAGDKSYHVTDNALPAIYIGWYGYKAKLKSDPLLVVPEQKFDCRATLDGTETIKYPPDVKKGIAARLPCRVVARVIHSHLPELGKLSTTKMYMTEYFFVVALPSSIVASFLKAIAADPKSPDQNAINFPFPATLDGVIDVFYNKIAPTDTKTGAGDLKDAASTDPNKPPKTQ